MSSLLLVLSVLTANLVLASPRNLAPLQATPGTVVVVTSDGFFVPDPLSPFPFVHILPSQFPGAPDFVEPAVEWQPRTNCFLVASGDQLFRVCDFDPQTIEDITPSTAAPMNLLDLDVDPGTGALYLLDSASQTVKRFQEPYVQGMVADLSIPVPATAMSLALNSRSVPQSLLVGEATKITRVYFDGSTQFVNNYSSPRGLDHDPQIGHVSGGYVCGGGAGVHRLTGSPLFTVLDAGCLLTPEDVEWDPIEDVAWVLARDGINGSGACNNYFACPGDQICGNNHVVRLRHAGGGPGGPELVTFPGDPNCSPSTCDCDCDGTGITGINGDLAVIFDDFAFISSYGEGCVNGSPSAMRLDVVGGGVPVAPLSQLTVQLSNAPPQTPAVLIAGLRSAIPTGFGCYFYSMGGQWKSFAMGSTDSQGTATKTFGLPGGLPAGTDVFLQGLAIPSSAPMVLSQGLMVHVGIE